MLFGLLHGALSAILLFVLCPAKQFYSLNTSALDALWHRAAVMALLRAKAKALVTEHNLGDEEKVVYKQCSRSAETVVVMAKCVRNLLRERDRIVERKMGRSRSKKELEKELEISRSIPGSTLEGLLGMLKETYGSFMGNGEGGGWQLKEEEHEAEEEHFVESDREEERRDEMQIKFEKNTLHFTHIKKGRRWKRATKFAHLDNLHELQRFLEMRRYCEDYLGRVAERNAEFLRSHLPYPVQLKFDINDVPEGINARMNDIVSMLTEFLKKSPKDRNWRRLSIMSPRLFPVIPPQTKPDTMAWMLLSPRLFSLSQNDGLLAIPDLLGGISGSSTDRWMNELLALSGTGKAIEKALEELKEERKRLEEKIFPMVVEMEKRDARWKHLLDPEQRRDMAEQGFAFLNADQLRHVYGSDETFDVVSLSTSQRKQRIEMAILALAELDDGHYKRYKRDEFGAERRKMKQNEVQMVPDSSLRILGPYTFVNKISDGVALGATILSPNAFTTELLSPDALQTQVLSPSAFYTTILSPEVLYSRILSPCAFSAQILSPSALTPYVLSPAMLITEILSPEAMEPRVLSPEIGVIKILNPELLSPSVLSAEQFAIMILSPSILSPSLLSHDKFIIEVISPHILSDSGEEESEMEEERHGQEQRHLENVHIGDEHGQEAGKGDGTERGHEKGDEQGIGHDQEAGDEQHRKDIKSDE